MSVAPEANTLIPAATILLLRDEPTFEVLAIERHSETPFAGGAVAFPGGRIDPADSDPTWTDHVSGYNDIAPEERSARIAAIRELFEETGLFFGRCAGASDYLSDREAEALDPYRAAVEADASVFLSLVREHDLQLAADGLHLFARWAPPANFTKRRYDTWFFAAAAPAGQVAREDGNEATAAIWIAPADALQDRAEGKRRMLFPTIRNLELLDVSNNAKAVFANARQRKIERIQPTVIERGGVEYIKIPEGLGYPVTEEKLHSALRS
ncbi:MAG: NUDIX hydrolase [Pseudomonadota bacterium]